MSGFRVEMPHGIRSTPNVKHAVKTIPIWRLLMDPSCDEKIKTIRKETEVLKGTHTHTQNKKTNGLGVPQQKGFAFLDGVKSTSVALEGLFDAYIHLLGATVAWYPPSNNHGS